MKIFTSALCGIVLVATAVFSAGCEITTVEKGWATYSVAEPLPNSESVDGFADCTGYVEFYGDIDTACGAMLWSEYTEASLLCSYFDANGNLWTANVLFTFPEGYIQDSCGANRPATPAGEKPAAKNDQGIVATPVDADKVEWTKK